MPASDLDPVELRRLLRDARSREATRQLTVLVAVAEGLTPAEAADWFGLETERVREWIAEYTADSPEAAVSRAERFGEPGRDVTPTGRTSTAHVEYLDHDVLRERGWDLDGEPFERARAADLGPPAYGGFTVEGGQSILDAAEAAGVAWPHSCRGGACSNCAVLVLAGEVSMPGSQILPDEALDEGARLTCVGTPITDRLQVVYNVDHLPFLAEYRLE